MGTVLLVFAAVCLLVGWLTVIATLPIAVVSIYVLSASLSLVWAIPLGILIGAVSAFCGVMLIGVGAGAAYTGNKFSN